MERYVGRFAPHFYALLRALTGMLFMWHGLQKLSGDRSALPRMMLAAGIIELVCGFLIAIGLLATWAAFLASGEMAIAYFIGHASHGDPLNPLTNKGELAVLYCFVFLYIAANGAGIWSIGKGRGEP